MACQHVKEKNVPSVSQQTCKFFSMKDKCGFVKRVQRQRLVCLVFIYTKYNKLYNTKAFSLVQIELSEQVFRDLTKMLVFGI